MNSIFLNNISFSYDGKNQVLSQLNLSVESGEFVALIGPNGGGKSTLIKVLLGLLKPQGEVRLFGQPVLEARSEIGYLPQYAHLDLNYPITVSEVILSSFLARNPLRRKQATDTQKLDAMLAQFELGPLKNRPLSALSGGQRQRVFLARALIHEPKLLILDEPTTALDTRSEDSFYAWLQTLCPEKTIVLVSHDLSVVSRIATKVCCLNRVLISHDAGKPFSSDELSSVYPCAVEFFAHGHPHRVVTPHAH